MILMLALCSMTGVWAQRVSVAETQGEAGLKNAYHDYFKRSSTA